MRRKLIKLFLTVLFTVVLTGPSFGSVSLYLVDDVKGSNPYYMTVSAQVLDLSSYSYVNLSGEDVVLDYSTNGTDWSTWTTNIDVYIADTIQQIFFKLIVNGNTYDTGTVALLGVEKYIEGIRTTATASIFFNEAYKLSFLSTDTENGDGYTTTPIPSVGLLIGTAFSGLFMFRRKVFKC